MGSSNTSEPLSAAKATLYCLDCGHESRINGDWLIEVHADFLDYKCPDCGTTIDSRRNGDDLVAQSDGSLSLYASN